MGLPLCNHIDMAGGGAWGSGWDTLPALGLARLALLATNRHFTFFVLLRLLPAPFQPVPFLESIWREWDASDRGHCRQQAGAWVHAASPHGAVTTLCGVCDRMLTNAKLVPSLDAAGTVLRCSSMSG